MKGYNMYRFKIIAFGIILTVLSFNACRKEWLEAKVDKQQNVPTTVKDFQALLDNTSSMNNCWGYMREYAADGHYYTENDYNLMAISNPFGINAYLWSAIYPYNEVRVSSSLANPYLNMYSAILNMNIILNESNKSKDSDIEGLNQVRAQALFHRGVQFFELVQTFAVPYKITTASTDLGIPLRLNTDITEPSVRSTVKQTYDQIIADLLVAKDVLPNTAVFITRASKIAALGMLSRVYLAMGDYENAFNYANQYLKIKNDLLDYNTISTNAQFVGMNKEVTFLKNWGGDVAVTTRYFIDQDLFDSYHQDDLRKTVFFEKITTRIGFKGTYTNSKGLIFMGIANDELYLIRAECYARLGDLTAAMKDLNDLLRTRWAKNPDGSTKYVNQTANTETEALLKILAERKKELILRNVRWTDLRRLNQDPRFAVTLTRTAGGKTYTLEPNSYRYTFPIPNEVIQKSTMKQNPGWQ